MADRYCDGCCDECERRCAEEEPYLGAGLPPEWRNPELVAFLAELHAEQEDKPEPLPFLEL